MAGGTDKPPLHTRLLQKLQGDVSTDSLSCSIFKVPNHLRQISEKAYEPQVISIGPYHHGKGQLMAMEVHKMFYLKMLLERIPEISLERYVTALKSMEEEARKFYSEPLNHIGGEEFVEMMLLDGCFIIELIRKIAMKKLRLKNDHLLTHFILTRVRRDLLLVENQLPFFILLELFDMTVMSNDEAKDFMAMAINFLSTEMPLPRSLISRSKNQDIKHLLGLLHYRWAFSPDGWGVHFSSPMAAASVGFSPAAQSTSFLPSKSSKEIDCTSASSVHYSVPLDGTSASLEIDAPEAKPSISSLPLESSFYEKANKTTSKVVESCIECASSHKRNEWQFIRSATELTEAGIKFKKIEGGFFDIYFEKGVMSVPTLTINDHTESMLRNLVAYEQCSKDASSKCFTDYITFMDCLINTGKDVELFRHRGVIDNCLGDDEVVATVFNKLRDSVLISGEDFNYAETFNEVNKHCNRKWNRWKANLWHNYFNTPWAGISFFAVDFLLLLTVLQSVYSVLSYHFK